MTGLDDNIEAIEQEPMPELYLFTSGTEQERITNYNEDLTFLGYKYKARPIERSRWTFDHNFAPTQVSISAPLTAIFINYISNNPIEPTNIKIYRALKSDLIDYRLIFMGILRGIQISQRQAKARFESKILQLDCRLPKILYQSYCNWDVFDSNCKLSEGPYRINTEVTISGSTLISTTFGGYSDGYFTAGRVVFGSNERWITNHVGNIITLQVPFDSRLSSGDTVTVYPGCDGKASTCKNKFNNFPLFLGFSYIPDHNPVIYGI